MKELKSETQRVRLTFSQRLAHFFHLVSEINPVVWIGIYICATPIFALIYWVLPEGQFRIPEGAGSDYGSWLYYSIVTISTLGFGDYTPAHGAAQAFTAIEVMFGLIVLGLFLNAVGAMKSEIDVGSEIEKQKAVHHAMETEKLVKSIPMVYDSLNIFLAYCYAVTTPKEKRGQLDPKYNENFTFRDLSSMFEPSDLPFDHTTLPAVERMLHSCDRASLALDSLQQRIDMTLWPTLLEDCFAFVANFQMFENTAVMFKNPERIVLSDNTGDEETAEKRLSKKISEWDPRMDAGLDPDLKSVSKLFGFIKENAKIAMHIETTLSALALSTENKNTK